MASATTLEPTIESYSRKYPDVPPEVILKEGLLRLGVELTDAALDAARGCRTQAYHLFPYNISGHHDLKEGVSTAAPEDIVFHGRPYQFKRTYLQAVLNGTSPYSIVIVDGKPAICEH